MYIINLLTVTIPVLLAVAFLTLVERKVLGYIQLRKGPNVVGPYGLLQPSAPAVKLVTKELLRPLTSSISILIIAPVPALTLALTMSSPTNPTPSDQHRPKCAIPTGCVKPSWLLNPMIRLGLQL